MDKPTVPEPSFGDPATPLTFDLKQAAALCGVSVGDLREWTSRGIVKAKGNGDHRFYDRESLRQILAVRDSGQGICSGRQSEFSLPSAEMDDAHLMIQTEMYFALNAGAEASINSLSEMFGVESEQMKRAMDAMIRSRQVSCIRHGSDTLYHAPRQQFRGPSIREQRVRATPRQRVPSRPI